MDIVVLNVLYDWFKDNKHHAKFWLLGFTCKNIAIIAAKKLSLQPIMRPNEKIINISVPFQVSSSHILLGIYIPYTGDFSVMADIQLSQVNTSNVRYFFMGCNDELYSIHSYDELITQIIVWRAEFELIHADHTYLFTIEPLEYLFILHGVLGTEWTIIRPIVEYMRRLMPAVQIIVNARNSSPKISTELLEYFKS